MPSVRLSSFPGRLYSLQEVDVRARALHFADFPSLNVSLLSCSRKDQEEQGQRKVQGALQQVPVHPGHHRQGEGREAEAVPASRSVP